jgi:hypothetical protein
MGMHGNTQRYARHASLAKCTRNLLISSGSNGGLTRNRLRLELERQLQTVFPDIQCTVVPDDSGYAFIGIASNAALLTVLVDAANARASLIMQELSTDQRSSKAVFAVFCGLIKTYLAAAEPTAEGSVIAMFKVDEAKALKAAE